MRYTEGVGQDGAAILFDGKQITMSKIIKILNESESLNEKENVVLDSFKKTFPKWDERNDIMHDIADEGVIIGGYKVTDANVICHLWNYDKWLVNNIKGLKGNTLE